MLVNSFFFALLFSFSGYGTASLLHAQNNAYFCPKETGDSCVLPGGAVFIIDTSSDLPDAVITEQFEYLRRNIFPFLPSYNVSIALMTYGTGDTSTDPYTSNVTESCVMLDTLQNSFISQGRYPVTLLKALKIYEVVYYDDDHTLFDGSPYPVFLFTGTTNVNDINNSAAFINKRLPDAQFNVIAFNNTDLLRSLNFPASYVYSFFELFYQNTDFHVCMRALMCGYLKKCDALGSTAIFTTPRVTQAMTSTSSSTVKPTTKPMQPTPPTTTAKRTVSPTSHSGGGQGDGTHSTGTCECDVGKVWNDVIYVVESSDATLKNGFEDMISYIQTVSQFFNIQKTGYKGTSSYMRMGLVVYSRYSYLVAGLGTLNNTDVFNLNPPYMYTDELPDMEGGLKLAITEFEKQSERKSSRKVIVLLASTYDPLSSQSPQVVMNDFHSDGGISIVLDYFESVGTETKHLKDLASPGYYMSSTDSTIPDMLQAECDANCFCKINYKFVAESSRSLPTQGCDYPVDLQSSFALAERNCDRNYGNSHLATAKTALKNNFIFNLTIEAQFLGLSLKNGAWTWDDGTTIGAYQNWETAPTTNSDDGACAIADLKSGKWHQSSCRNPFQYICEKKPCSSVNYCDNLTD